MSLHVYTKMEYIPKGIDYVWYNDNFFDNRILYDDEVTKYILDKVEEAQFNNSRSFIGRNKGSGPINKENLSTGSKTFINIAHNPNICFDVFECGENVLALLPIIKEGHILWRYPCVFSWSDIECDIVLYDENGKQYFKKFRDFLHCTMND